MNRMVGGGNVTSIEKICVDKDPSGYKESLSRYCKGNVNTFPQIFINDKHVGGYSDFARKFPNVI